MSEETLQIAVKRREMKGEKESYTHLNAEFQRNVYFSFIDYAKAFECVDHPNCGKFWKRWEYQTMRPASWEICMQVKKQQLELDMEQQTGSK